MDATRMQARRLEVPDSAEAVNDIFYERGWTDGLPIIPPTKHLVTSMLEASSLPPHHIMGVIPPREGSCTVEKVAINAVMAGCKPDHLPVVLAAVKATLHEEFNIGATSTTTGGVASVVIVNGPLSLEAGINGGTACFGTGFRANAAIGRALRLVLRNVGGAIPEESEKSTQAWPGKFACCLAENEERSPWEPLHVELGYPPGASTVTVMGVRGLIPMSDSTSDSGERILETFVGSMRMLGVSGYYFQGRRSQILLVICPEHSAAIAGSGFSKGDVKQYVYEHARISKAELLNHSYYANRVWPPWIEEADPSVLVPLVGAPEDTLIIVAGGDGGHSAWMPAWPFTQAVTEPIEE